MAIKNRQILLHTTGCVLFLLMPVFFSPDLFRASYLFSIPPFQRDFLSYVLLLLFFYLSYFYIVPRLYFSKKYKQLTLVLIVCFLVMVILPDLIIKNGGHGPEHYSEAINNKVHPIPHTHVHHKHHSHSTHFELFFLGNKFFKFMMVLAFSFLLNIHFRWKKAVQEKTDTELSYLKAQINPHFLFNTLNGIYSLAITKSENTADAIVKLSGLMRYIITEASQEMVPLDKEISYISDYIALQKMRLDETVSLNYEVAGNSHGKHIAPLILIAFIENAFKHGVNPEEESSISVRINITDAMLKMYVQNNKVSLLNDGENITGVGIANAKSRLQLLYPSSHELSIENEPNRFTVNLTIKFA